MPTSGTNRPGPLGGLPATAQPGVRPVRLTIERLGIDAPIESFTFTNDVPSLPETPEIVAWYQRSAPLGVPGVMLLGGSSALADTGPSAFTRLSEVQVEDRAVLIGANHSEYHFDIVQSEPLASPPDFTTLLHETVEERLVLLGWEGPFQAALAAGAVHLVAGVRVVATPPAG